ncbi:hypothetical protein JCM33374_g5819 [Metschnikowia sp. JCM 33374]|nr:hypothetical protein JCM33374_g5819 [Metschnikowia sp. JCM 33374]
MAGTLRPDPEFQRFNTAKEKLGHYFRFTTRSALFNVFFVGVIPVGLTLMAYNKEGQSFSRLFRKDAVLDKEYVPRKKDL